MKTQKSRIIVDLILIILGIIFLVFGIKDLVDKINSTKIDDATRFKSEYSYVSKENNYEYLTFKKFEKMINSKTGVILLGSPLDPWTQVLVEPLNVVAKEENTIIDYLDVNEYKNIIKKSKILDNFDVPKIIFIKNGKINTIINKEDIYDKEFDDAPIEYWTDEKLEEFNSIIKSEVEKLVG